MTLVQAALAGAAVLAAPHADATSYPSQWPLRAPWKLNQELLVPQTARIVFVVDAPQGASRPRADALDHLASLAAKYGAREARWVWLSDSSAPRVQWLAAKDHFAEIPSCPDGPLDAATSYVFVRYMGQWGSDYGRAKTVAADRSCGARSFAIIYLAQDRIALDGAPVFSPSYLETRALAHEYGHVLGLASNPAHGRWGPEGPHCANPTCALAIPNLPALLKGAMVDYCEDCRRDIEKARDHWHSLRRRRTGRGGK